MKRLMGDQDNIGENLRSTIQAFTPAVRDIVESFEFHLQVDKLDKAGLLCMVCERFAQIDLHPETVSNAEMGLVFEELIRKFAELSNETAGEHFTPREVLKLMVNLIFSENDQALTQAGIVRSWYDPTAGTGGMLSVAEEHHAGLLRAGGATPRERCLDRPRENKAGRRDPLQPPFLCVHPTPAPGGDRCGAEAGDGSDPGDDRGAEWLSDAAV